MQKGYDVYNVMQYNAIRLSNGGKRQHNKSVCRWGERRVLMQQREGGRNARGVHKVLDIDCYIVRRYKTQLISAQLRTTEFGSF